MAVVLLSHLCHAASDLRRGQLIPVITVGASAGSHTALEMEVWST